MSGPIVTVSIDRVAGGTTTVHLRGEVDLSNFADVEVEIRSATTTDVDVAIDVSELSYIDSQGLHLLARLEDHYRDRGARCLVVAPVDSFAGQVLEIARPRPGGITPWT